MDNRIFNVNGRNEELLLKALELAFEQSGFKCKGWLATKQGLVLTWYVDGKTTPLPTTTGMTAAEVLPMVLSWLKSDGAKAVESTGWDADMDHDGHNSLGWRVFCEDWGHVGGSSSAICAVKPAYMWHGK
jgi:hypothetical protein